MHKILHVPAEVKDLGPLFTSSCFDHEDNNGKLAKMVHSQGCIDADTLIFWQPSATFRHYHEVPRA